ncbi:hypothetical protein QBC33DRAFT_501813 [Phialemonium atrogriseum]|uniref:Uncharacterized protein n=1 Tax=Phialemonium atrogriseum TaxID=1093897 RepID=A0AAJ0BS89_9PEZI|nr:uncharacterized protein QBC33DRAFT_501813 [Phialemonium atrogriseum]KAK1762082.1 hypothetical protein QBC33DRAFT_501813 [Phialemonium atrogriseum]
MHSTVDPAWGETWPVYRREGDIVFLKFYKSFDPDDYATLIETNYLDRGATCHPVIILKLSSGGTHAIITTVSAYGSNGHNHLPPWEQPRHIRKCPEDFRSFEGSARVSSSHRLLYLEDGMGMPKPNASWVYIRSLWTVPVSVFAVLDDAPQELRLTQASLEDLLRHMEERCGPRLRECRDRLESGGEATPSSGAPLDNRYSGN